MGLEKLSVGYIIKFCPVVRLEELKRRGEMVGYVGMKIGVHRMNI
jgi:hypothetical protein